MEIGKTPPFSSTPTIKPNSNKDNCSIVANFGSFDVSFKSQADQTEYCGIAIQVDAPAGQQFSAASTSYKDVIDVGSGITASHLLTYTFSGSESTSTLPLLIRETN